jgi:dTMP kinase
MTHPFIVFEGIDGSGKTTQARLLAQKLNGVYTSEPTSSDYGLKIRKLLNSTNSNDTELALLFALDRLKHCQTIQTHLKTKPVICDRYYYSSLAYQSMAGVDKEWLKQINKHFLEPDVIVFIKTNVEQAISRLDTNEKYERKEFLMKVQEEYEKTFQNKKNVIIIDNTNMSILDTHKTICSRIKCLL